MPFIIAVFIFIVIAVARGKLAAQVQQQQQAQKSAQRSVPGAPAQKPVMQQTVGRPQVLSTSTQTSKEPVYDEGRVFTKPVAKYVPPEKSREQLAEEAKQLVRALTGKSVEELKRVGSSQSTAKPTSARKVNERPTVKHSDADCGGGSIHDGYHEGVSGDPFGEHKGTAVAGNLGKRLGDEAEKANKEQVSYDNAQRIVQKISKLPPLTQGIVFSEILGKPKSEVA